MNGKLKIFVLSMVAFFLFSNIMPSFGEDRNIDKLKSQIDKLQKRVEELETQNSQGKDSFLPVPRNRQEWDPFEELSRMQEQMNRMFEDSFNWRGASNKGLFGSSLFYDQDFGFTEKDNKYILKFDISGLDKDKIEINVNDHYISLKCESKKEDNSKKNNQYFSSRSYSTFYKSFPLPADADTLSMTTEKKGDKLIITLPKKNTSSATSQK